MVRFGHGLATEKVFSNLNDSRILKTGSGEALPEVLSLRRPQCELLPCELTAAHQPNATKLEHSKFSRNGRAGPI